MRTRSCELAALIALVLGLSAPLPAQSKVELEGSIFAVNGTTVQLFDGLVTFEARGAKIETDDENFTNVADLPVGTAIETEAVVHGDGSIAATRVEVSDEKEQDSEIGGVIGTVDTAAQTFTIGSLTIGWDGQTKFKDIPRPIAGQLVEVSVRVSGGRLFAVAVEKEEADD